MIMIGKVQYTVEMEQRTIWRAMRVDDQNQFKNTREKLEKALKILVWIDSDETTKIKCFEYDVIREIDPNFIEISG